MEKFKNQFLKLLRENPELERQAMEASLDDGVSGEDYDLDMEDTGEFDEVAAAAFRRNQQEVQTLDSWANQINQFLTFFSKGPSSVLAQLAVATEDGILGEVKKKQSEIARIGSDLGGLYHSLLGFKAMSSNKS